MTLEEQSDKILQSEPDKLDPEQETSKELQNQQPQKNSEASEEKDEDIQYIKIKQIDPDKIKPNPINKRIYSKRIGQVEGEEEEEEEEEIEEIEEASKGLVESIAEKGQLEPLVVTKSKNTEESYVIISGHRRWAALKKLKLKANCIIIKPFENELDETEAIIEYNKQRKKLPSQLYNEAVQLKRIYAEKAKKRQLDALNQNAVGLDPTQREQNQIEAGRTRNKVADALGISPDMLRKLAIIGDLANKKADEEDIESINEAEIVMRKLNSGELTVDAAAKIVDMIEISKSDKPESEFARDLKDKYDKGDITPNKADKLLKDHIKSISNQKIPIGELPAGKHAVILINPTFLVHPRRLKGSDLTDAENAVLFIWATNQSMEDSIELMQMWGFKLKSIAVLEKKQDSGTWFSGPLEFLLLGIKGEFQPPKSENRFSSIIQVGENSKNGIPELVYEKIIEMFPGEEYLNLASESAPPGWISMIQEPEASPESSDTQQNNVNQIEASKESTVSEKPKRTKKPSNSRKSKSKPTGDT